MSKETMLTRHTCKVCSREYYTGEGWAPHRCTLKLQLRVYVADFGILFEVARQIEGPPEAELTAIVESIEGYFEHAKKAPALSPEGERITALAGAAHEGARDDRIRRAWRKRGLVVVPQTRAEPYGVREAILVRVRLSARDTWELRAVYPFETYEAVRREMVDRASSMRAEEQIAYWGLVGRSRPRVVGQPRG